MNVNSTYRTLSYFNLENFSDFREEKCLHKLVNVNNIDMSKPIQRV